MNEKTGKLRRLTVTIPEDLIPAINQIAREQGISRSKLISSCLKDMTKKQYEELLSGGYREMAVENLEFAYTSVTTASEALGE